MYKHSLYKSQLKINKRDSFYFFKKHILFLAICNTICIFVLSIIFTSVSSLMSKKDKIKEQFLLSPRTLTYAKIYSFLMNEGYIEIDGKGSHTRIKDKKTWKSFVVPIHNWECKWIYKEELKNFYLSTQN
jgi:hypothetical protein